MAIGVSFAEWNAVCLF